MEEEMPSQQTSAAPTRKVTAGGTGGAIVIVIVFILNTYKVLPGGAQVTGEVAAALTTIISFAVSYLVPPSRRDQVATTETALGT